MKQSQEQIREHIRSESVNKTIIPELQAIHIRGSGGYIPGRSYLLDGVNAQELVNRYHGTGHIPIAQDGTWSKEVVTAHTDIGINIEPQTGIGTPTNRFVIHYRVTGTHIVPTRRR